jgi:ABC-type nitrate/sulfonate/bicarbonate transport system substrate-binding protein
MPSRRQSVILWMTLALVAWSAAASGKAAGAAPAKVTMAWVAVSGAQAVAWIAAEGGHFKQRGLDVTLEYVSGSPTAAAALVSGSIQFVEMAGPAVVFADAHGAHLVMVMGFVNQPVFVLMTTPDVEKPEQLKGKTVAVTKMGSSDDFMLREALSHWGLRPGEDVRITGVGSVAAQVAAVEKRLVQGIVVSPPNDVLAEQAGARVLARISDLGIPYQASGLVTTREYIQGHADVVVRVVMAMTEAIHRYKTDTAFAEKVLAKYLKTSDRKIVEHSYRVYADVFPSVPAPSAAGMAEIVKEETAAGHLTGGIDAASMVDTSFVDALERSGFIARLYRGR